MEMTLFNSKIKNYFSIACTNFSDLCNIVAKISTRTCMIINVC